jgi:hypothetical protein
MKWSLWILCLSFTVPHAWAAEPVTADDAIQAAIDQLEQSVDKVNDPLAKARIHKAIRELEIILNAGSETPVAPKITFEVKPAVLKKKFQGKAAFDPKSGELSLIYDFTRKEQLKDFEVKKDAQYTLLNKSLILDGGEQITHIAKFKAFTVSGVLGVKTMKWGGVSSTNGSAFSIQRHTEEIIAELWSGTTLQAHSKTGRRAPDCAGRWRRRDGLCEPDDRGVS